MKQNYMATGIPQLLEPRPKAYKKLITLDQLGIIMEHEERAVLPISGDCLEGAGVMDGGCPFHDSCRDCEFTACTLDKVKVVTV